MSRLFSHCVTIVLQHEGGYSFDPNDRGGETRFGISKRAYPGVDIAKLTREDAIELYRRDYWSRIHGDGLPHGIALIVFDAAVNQGVRFASKAFQHALGVAPDGIVGPETLRAAEAATLHADSIVREIAARRGYRYGINPNVTYYGLGWMRRLCDVLDHSLRLCKEPIT